MAENDDSTSGLRTCRRCGHAADVIVTAMPTTMFIPFDAPLSDLGLSKRTFNAFVWSTQADTVGKALAYRHSHTVSQMLELWGLGRKGLRELDAALARVMPPDLSSYHLRIEAEGLRVQRAEIMRRLREVDALANLVSGALSASRLREERERLSVLTGSASRDDLARIHRLLQSIADGHAVRLDDQDEEARRIVDMYHLAFVSGTADGPCIFALNDQAATDLRALDSYFAMEPKALS